jgi:hypothetical protein
VSHSLAYYVRTAATMPPRELARKLAARLTRTPVATWKRIQYRLGLARIGDRDLARSLHGPLDVVLERMGEPGSPRFFFDARDRAALVAAALEAAPGDRERSIDAAERVMRHELDLLGSGPVALGERIDWHRDFKSGRTWPPVYHRDVTVVDLGDDSDIKVVWELSRFTHLLALGKAYAYTGDERYAAEYTAQVLSWIAANPPLTGANWACAMEVAIRAVHWIWAYEMFRPSPALTPSFKVELLKSVLAHGRFILANLEYCETREAGRSVRLNSNHYLADLVGLVYLGLMFPEFREAGEWLRLGVQELFCEIEEQVHPDGVDYEHSTSYHRLVTEMFTSAFLLAARNGVPVPAAAWQRLERMYEFVEATIRPDGRSPQIGDSDDGRLHPLGWSEMDDHRYLLAIGAALFGRADFKAACARGRAGPAPAAASVPAELVWLLGPDGIARFRALPDAGAGAGATARSRAFPHGGFYVLAASDIHVVCDAGGGSIRGRGGHHHNDTGSFELSAGGRAWIVDPGSYVYSADPAARNLFRSTAYHNTVVVDGQEMNRMNGSLLFLLGDEARGEVLAWRADAARDVLEVRHHGYARLGEAVVHDRRLGLDRAAAGGTALLVQDRLTGGGIHGIESFLHFDAGIDLERADAATFVARAGPGEHVVVRAVAGRGEGTSGAGGAEAAPPLTAAIRDGWVSRRYGVRQRAPVLVLAGDRVRVPVSLAWVVVPQARVDLDAVSAIAERLVRTGPGS